MVGNPISPGSVQRKSMYTSDDVAGYSHLLLQAFHFKCKFADCRLVTIQGHGDFLRPSPSRSASAHRRLQHPQPHWPSG